MIGNIWEWCADWRGEDYYSQSPEADPSGPTSSTYRIDRGGSWFTGAQKARSAYRNGRSPTRPYNDVGFRLAAAISPGDSPGAKTAGAATSPHDLLTSPDYEWSAVENLGPVVNSAANETGACLSGRGLSLLFASDRGGSEGFDIYTCTRTSADSPWGPPQRSDGVKINSARNDAAPSLSADRLSLFYYRDDRPPTGKADLFKSTRATMTGPWSAAVSLGPLVNSDSYDYSPEISADGLELFFHSGRGSKNSNLYAARRASLDEPFSSPVNLGTMINGLDHEYDPCLSSDGRVLLFYSTRPSDPKLVSLWMSTRTDREGKWSAPVQLDIPRSGDTHDFGPALSHDGGTLIFHGDRARGVGGNDLWMVRRVRKQK